MRMIPMLEEKDPLPGPQSHPAIDNRNDLTTSTQHHANVGGHVIRTFVGVNKVWRVFRNKMIKERMKIRARAGVGIFHDDQARTGVLDENRDGARLDTRIGNNLGNLPGDLISSLAR